MVMDDTTLSTADDITLEEVSDSDIIGTVVDGKYTLLKQLGSGGWATVFLAKQETVGRVVALKMLQADLVFDKNSTDRFRQEAAAACKLIHPNICACFDYGLFEGIRPYIVMEYVEGQNIFEYARANAPLDIKTVLDIFLQLCDALQTAHDAGIVHRDVKPSNILITISGGKPCAKLVDFGLAKHHKEGESLTRTGETLGTPAYMSPQQVYGHKVDARSDIYSLGCTLFHCLALKPPFTADSDFEVMMKHAQAAPPSLKDFDVDPAIVPYMDQVLHIAMEKEPDRRQQSAAEFAKQLREFVPNFTGEIARNKPVPPKTKADKAVPYVLWGGGAIVVVCLAMIAMLPDKPVRPTPKALPAAQSIAKPIPIVEPTIKNLTAEEEKLVRAKEAERTGVLVFDLYVPTPQDIEPLVPYLKSVHLSELKDQRVIDVLAKAKQLRELTLYRSQLSKHAFEVLQTMPLSTLRLEWQNIGQDGLQSIAKLPHLKTLELTNCSLTITSPSVFEHSSIEKLNLRGSQADARALIRAAQAIEGLKDLEISLQLTANDARELANIKTLRRLSLNGSKLTNFGLDAIATLPNVEDLDLYNTYITNDGLRLLKRMPKLKRLQLGPSRFENEMENLELVSDEGLKQLEQVRGLESVNIQGWRFTGKALRILAEHPNLKAIGFKATVISSKDLQEARDKNPQITIDGIPCDTDSRTPMNTLRQQSRLNPN